MAKPPRRVRPRSSTLRAPALWAFARARRTASAAPIDQDAARCASVKPLPLNLLRRGGGPKCRVTYIVHQQRRDPRGRSVTAAERQPPQCDVEFSSQTTVTQVKGEVLQIAWRRD